MDARIGLRSQPRARANGRSDLADAHVALLVHPQERVLTSDEADIKALLQARRVKAVIVRV